MKRAFLFAPLFFLIPFWSNGQDNIPFPLENTSWYNSFYVCTDELTDCLLTWVRDYHMNGDTLINEQVMTKVTTSTISPWEFQDSLPPTNYIGALREDSTRVYFVPWYQNDEVLLYDFSVAVGDTVNVFTIYGEEELIIEEVYYENFNFGGIIRKVVWHDGGLWVEGLGNVQGIFQSNYFNLSGFVLRQECIVENGQTIYDNDWPEFDCGPMFTTTAQLEISIYPNPAQTYFTIEGIEGQAYLEILDLQGQLIQSEEISNSFKKVVLREELRPGVYLIRMTAEDQSAFHRIVIEN